MSPSFLTPAASISLGKEPSLDGPRLPQLEQPPSVPVAVVGMATVACSLLEPALSPVLFGMWMTFQLALGLGFMVHEKRLLRQSYRVHQRAAALLGEWHPATRTLGRYHRILTRLMRGRPPPRSFRAVARRWALAQRLAHRCQHLLNEWPRLTEPAPTPRTPLARLECATHTARNAGAAAATARMSPLMLRARARRMARSRR